MLATNGRIKIKLMHVCISMPPILSSFVYKLSRTVPFCTFYQSKSTGVANREREKVHLAKNEVGWCEAVVRFTQYLINTNRTNKSSTCVFPINSAGQSEHLLM